MQPIPLPAHGEIDPRFTWNAESLFASREAWQIELEQAAPSLAALGAFRGRLAEGPAVLAQALETSAAIMRRVGRLLTYSSMSYAVDTTDPEAARMNSQARALLAQASAATAYLEPELLGLGETLLKRWIVEEPGLAYLGHYLDNLFRRQAHVRSSEVEEVLGLLTDTFGAVEESWDMLTAADLRFPAAIDLHGTEFEVTQSRVMGLLSHPDRQVRRMAWEGYHDAYRAHRNTLAAMLATSIKRSVFLARVRRHASTLEATLFEDNLPPAVFHTLIATFRRHLPDWQRYFRVRRKALGVERLQPYDMWAPLTADRPAVEYSQAVDWICEGLAPLGAAYVSLVRRGCGEDRWVDVYPCKGKAGGAFSTGRQGTLPFIKMNFNDNLLSLGTLAHELGHSVHSYLTWEQQPYVYSGHSTFVAEVASNFHQAMVRAHLLEHIRDPRLHVAVIEEAMANFYRYFFLMPTLARFELEIHQREEQGKGLSAEDMIRLCADLFSEGFGDAVEVDRERVGILWATFPHLYADYYVFQYATGISGAQALARRILGGVPGAVDEYLAFLGAGSSLYPLQALARAGVDLTEPEPVEVAFGVMRDMVDRLESAVQRAPGAAA